MQEPNTPPGWRDILGICDAELGPDRLIATMLYGFAIWPGSHKTQRWPLVLLAFYSGIIVTVDCAVQPLTKSGGTQSLPQNPGGRAAAPISWYSMPQAIQARNDCNRKSCYRGTGDRSLGFTAGFRATSSLSIFPGRLPTDVLFGFF